MESSLTPADRGYVLARYLSPIDDSLQPFALWVPASYNRRKAYPLIVALHGADADERMIPEECLQIPRVGFHEGVILLSPFGRGELGYRWMGEADIWHTIHLVKSLFRVDSRRQYLTGLSMGGFATWRLAADYPEQWAAIAPVCGGAAENRLGPLEHMPVWCVHGEKDPIVPVEQSRRLMKRLMPRQKESRYTELGGWGHNSWEWLYRPGRKGHPLVRWFLKFRKKQTAPPRIKPDREEVFNDLFKERVVISFGTDGLAATEMDLLRREAEVFAKFSFGDWIMRSGRLLMKPDRDVSAPDLASSNHLMIGRTDQHVWMKGKTRRLRACQRRGFLEVAGETFLGKSLVGITCQASPWNSERLLGIITAQRTSMLRGIAGTIGAAEPPLGWVNVYDAESQTFLAGELPQPISTE